MIAKNQQPQTGHKRIAVVVGRGLLPRELVKALVETGRSPLLIGIEGETESWLQSHPHKVFPWGKIGSFFKYLRRNGIQEVVLAGGVTRPKVEIHKLDFGAFLVLPQILSFMIGGDNSLLTGLIKLFNSKGMEIVGAHEVMPDLVAPAGLIAGKALSKTADKNMQKAFAACKTLGAMDIGQAAVAVGGRVVAVEGIEGTDEMLARVEDLRDRGRLRETGRHGPMVKTMKPDQDMRVDLPTIGPDTIKRAALAGLSGVAVESGRTLILSKSETISAANEAGLFIFGLPETEAAIS